MNGAHIAAEFRQAKIPGEVSRENRGAHIDRESRRAEIHHEVSHAEIVLKPVC